jgi:hypothetical protein
MLISSVVTFDLGALQQTITFVICDAEGGVIFGRSVEICLFRLVIMEVYRRK